MIGNKYMFFRNLKMGERNNPLMKKLDKWIGCPLLFLLGLFHRSRKRAALPESNIRIALIKTAAVGDTIILSAMIDEIRQQYPNCDLTVICSKNNYGMVKILKGVDHILKFNMKTPLQSLQEVASIGYLDLVLDFGPWPRINGIIAWKAKAAYKIGFRRTDTYRHYVYDHKVIHSDEVHEIENYRNILRAAGISVTGRCPDFHTDMHVRKDRNYVIFHLYPGGAMRQQRSWRDTRWLELGKYIYHQYGMIILFSGGPADHESAERIVRLLKEEGVIAENIAGTYSLQEMASVLQYAQLVVSVNTGIMHYAAAVGVPLIAIHGATSEVRWGPLSENAIVVKSGEVCQPCISLGFESNCKNPRCMEHVSVEMVIAEVDKIMEE